MKQESQFLTATLKKIYSTNHFSDLNKIKSVVNYPGIWDDKCKKILNEEIERRHQKLLN